MKEPIITTIVALILAIAPAAQAYELLNSSLKTVWHSGDVPYYVELGVFDHDADSALSDWSQYTGATHLRGIDTTSASAWGNHRNEIVWSKDTIYTLPGNVLAWTMPNYNWTSGQMIETDIVLNSSFFWDSGSGYDIERVLLHEIGHSIGLGHSDNYSVMSANYYAMAPDLTSDDIAGARFLYSKSLPDSGNALALFGLACAVVAVANLNRTNKTKGTNK